jgi:outer membrane biosynthesis protein TonB
MVATFLESDETGSALPDVASLVVSTTTLQKPSLTIPDVAAPAAVIESASDSEDEAQPTEAKGDQAGHSAMFGRYMGQITARIQRAWIRPRSPIATNAFLCRVRIQEDTRGNVQEIEIGRCNGDSRWQRSLVNAIWSASPLPAPPEAGLFRKTLTLELDSETYAPGSRAEGFER